MGGRPRCSPRGSGRTFDLDHVVFRFQPDAERFLEVLQVLRCRLLSRGGLLSGLLLRGICSHVGAIVIPLTVSVARVQEIFDEQGNCEDASTEKRIRSAATTLIDYIRGAVCPRITLEAIVLQSRQADPEQR